MAVEFGAAGTAHSGTGATSAAVGCPSGISAGHLLVTCFGLTNNFFGSGVTLPTSLPSGWTALATSSGSPNRSASAIYYKIATGSEGSSQTFSGFSAGSSSGWQHRAVMFRFTGVDTTTPFISGQYSVTANTSTTPAQIHPSQMPTVAGSGVLLFRMMFMTSNINRSFTSSITLTSAPAGVERYDPNQSGSLNGAVYTRNGGFPLVTQIYSTTANTTGSVAGNHLWTAIIAASGWAPPAGPGDSVGVLMA